MYKKHSVLILGEGRIAQAVAQYFKKYSNLRKVGFLSHDKDVSRYDLLVGALPGELGERCLTLALRYRKNLIDISDVDPPYYLKYRKKIEDCGIVVVPGCGFSPGLVNFILGRELSALRTIDEIEIKAGSLSSKKFFFPFLWCFEDLILEHQIPSWQRISGRKVRCLPFAAYQSEKFFGIEAESYFCASGFENLLDAAKAHSFTCRVIRPYGFMDFFNFLKNHKFLSKNNKISTKIILESVKEDNITLAEVAIATKGRKITWLMKSFSSRGEFLNSMQKITASMPVVLGRFLLEETLGRRGLIFMEELGRDEALFERFTEAIKMSGTMLRRSVTRIS